MSWHDPVNIRFQYSCFGGEMGVNKFHKINKSECMSDFVIILKNKLIQIY